MCAMLSPSLSWNRPYAYLVYRNSSCISRICKREILTKSLGCGLYTQPKNYTCQPHGFRAIRDRLKTDFAISAMYFDEPFACS